MHTEVEVGLRRERGSVNKMREEKTLHFSSGFFSHSFSLSFFRGKDILYFKKSFFYTFPAEKRCRKARMKEEEERKKKLQILLNDFERINLFSGGQKEKTVKRET